MQIETVSVPSDLSLTAAQCRMARAAIDLCPRNLADFAGVHAVTILSFERGKDVRRATREKLRSAFEELGVIFLDDLPHGGRGVCLAG